MIAAENNGKLAGFKYRFNFRRKLFARVADFANKLKLLLFFRKYLWPFEPQVAEVPDGISQPRDALVEPSHTQRRRANVHSGHTRAVTERNTQNRHRFFQVCTHAGFN